MQLSGYIENRELLVYNKMQLLNWIIRNDGKMVTIKFTANTPTRSNNQNWYYWGVVVQMVHKRLVELGNEIGELDTHEFLKSKFNYKQVEVKEGHYIDIPQTTTDMLTTDFMTYLDKIKEFASTMLDLYIPDPNEQLFFHE